MSNRSGIKGVVPIDKMASEIAKQLGEWNQEMADATIKAVAETCAETVLELKRTSRQLFNGNAYASSWKTSVLEHSRYGQRNVIHNEKHYRLTHLLENGHNNPRAKNPGAKTFTQGRPHIGLAEAHAMQMLEEKMEQYYKDVFD